MEIFLKKNKWNDVDEQKELVGVEVENVPVKILLYLVVCKIKDENVDERFFFLQKLH